MGGTIYQVHGVEAVLVGPQGIAIPFLTEFCANSEERTEETKQDSELKAFRRLAKRLRALFPKLPLTACIRMGRYLRSCGHTVGIL